jgi:hypothetical protein
MQPRCRLFLAMILLGVVPGFAHQKVASRKQAPAAPPPSRHGGLSEATERPKKIGATCLIDHKWRYNQNVSPPQSWGC